MNKNKSNYNKYKFIEKNFYNLRNQICSEFEAIENQLKPQPNINLKPGKFIHIIGDCHAYENHIGAIKEQIQRIPNK